MTAKQNLVEILNLKPYLGTPYTIEDNVIIHAGRKISTNAAINQAAADIQSRERSLSEQKHNLSIIRRSIQ